MNNNIFPQDLLPYGEANIIDLSEIYDAFETAKQNLSQPLTSLTHNRPEVAKAIQILYAARDIWLDTNPEFFYRLYNKLPPHLGHHEPGTVGAFLYETVTICQRHGADKVCYPYKFAEEAVEHAHNTITIKDDHASIWIYANDQFLGISAKDTSRADIHVQYQHVSDFEGLTVEEIEKLRQAGVVTARIKAQENATEYKPIDKLPLHRNSGSRIGDVGDHSSSGNNNGSGSGASNGFWIFILVVILLLLAIYFAVTNYSKM